MMEVLFLLLMQPFTAATMGAAFASSSTPASAASYRDLDAFYSNVPLDDMRMFLGPSMHFHHGLASGEVDRLLGRAHRTVDDGESGLDDAVRVLYPHVPQNASILDVGCGWCGPAALLAAERGAEVTGVTIAEAQADFCRSRGIPAIHADVEVIDARELMRTAPASAARGYDVALLLESLDHVRDKGRVLRMLRGVARTLVLRTHCNPALAADASTSEFSGSMPITSCANVTNAVAAAGWELVAEPKIWGAAEAAQTHRYWRRGLEALVASRERRGLSGVGLESGRGASHVLQVLLMASDGFGWLRMASNGFGWLRMASDGCGWLRMASGGL